MRAGQAARQPEGPGWGAEGLATCLPNPPADLVREPSGNMLYTGFSLGSFLVGKLCLIVGGNVVRKQCPYQPRRVGIEFGPGS